MPSIHLLIRSGGLTLMSLMPLCIRPQARHSVLWALVPVLVTYATSAVAGAYLMKWTSTEDAARTGPDASDVVGLWIGVGVLTLAHVAIPTVVYIAHLSRVVRTRGDTRSAFVYLFSLVWFGAPIVALAAQTGWLTLIAAVVHLTLARPWARHWVFVEYGSTSFALLLFVLNFGGAILCASLPIVIFQALVLALLSLWGREVVVMEDPDEPRLSLRRAKREKPSQSPPVGAKRKRKRRKRRGKS